MSENKTFSVTFNRRFKEAVGGGYLIIDQLNNQVNFHLGKGTWYAKNYSARESEDGTITLSVEVEKIG